MRGRRETDEERRKAEGDRPRERRATRSESEPTWLESERDERKRERRTLKCDMARACPNLGDTREAKRATQDASNERSQTSQGGERESGGD